MLPPRDLQTTEALVLEWLHHYARQEINPECLSDAEFVTHINRVTDRLVVTMKARVLSNRRDPEVEEVPFAKSMQIEHYASWWQGFKPEWIARRWPRKTAPMTVMVEGTVPVTRTPYDTFPECTIRYPKDLGRVVVQSTYEAPDYRAA